MPVVTFDSNARLYLSSAFLSIHDIAEKGYVGANLYYNKADKVVALQLLKDQPEGAFSVRFSTHKGKQAGAFVNARFFCVKYGMMDGEKLADKYKGRYTAEKQEVAGLGEVFVIDFKQKRE